MYIIFEKRLLLPPSHRLVVLPRHTFWWQTTV